MAPGPLFALADQQRGFDPIHFRHLDIHQNQIKGVLLKSRQRFPPVLCGRYPMSPPLQDQGGEFPVDRMVFGEENR